MLKYIVYKTKNITVFKEMFEQRVLNAKGAKKIFLNFQNERRRFEAARGGVPPPPAKFATDFLAPSILKIDINIYIYI